MIERQRENLDLDASPNAVYWGLRAVLQLRDMRFSDTRVAHFDVLIVGAGPTGLMLANQLVRRAMKVMIIDRHAGPTLQTRALVVQARTLEIYAKLRLCDRALELGKRATGANLWTRGRRTARVPLGDIGREMSPYPFLLILGQDDNERLLGDGLSEQGAEVSWRSELVDFKQHANCVTATLKEPGNLREITAKWLVGCDGAHSTVRERCGIQFSGAPYEQVFFVADTTVTGPMVADELNVFLWPRGFHLLFPMRGVDHWRVVGLIPPELRTKEDLQFKDMLPSVASDVGVQLSFQDCCWFSAYPIHHRCADRFRDRRCFLAGDAAHIHSPVGAQGMNTGLQDAYNLAWKLALVEQSGADPALLDTYETERLPFARRLLRTTDRAFSMLVSKHRLAGFLRTRLLAKVLAFAMRIARIRRLAFLTISQIGIHYRGSALSVETEAWPQKAPSAGDRFPWMRLCFESGAARRDLFELLDDRRFNLL
ncbi:MAG: FAD-dependent monooxygenase, partial [Gammaproteobacteria bacterium]